jgi:cathepsin L
LMDDAFQYIINNNGIDTEASYPYTAEDGYCQYSAANCGSVLAAFQDVQSGSESSLQVASAGIGPVSVAIDASHNSFQLYTSGVYYEPNCSPTQLDHGVLAVGYGSSSGSDYWIVKNSWGTDWGMNGYIWMSRNRNNNCGIATAASYPISAGAGNCA